MWLCIRRNSDDTWRLYLAHLDLSQHLVSFDMLYNGQQPNRSDLENLTLVDSQVLLRLPQTPTRVFPSSPFPRAQVCTFHRLKTSLYLPLIKY